MIYSGANLIRASERLVERFGRATGDAPRPVSDAPSGQLNDETQNALVRFARFLNRDKQPPPRKKALGRNPYETADEREAEREARGQNLDIRV